MEYRYRDASEMKNSGIEWIGKIPKDVSIKRLKYDLVFQKGNNPKEINNEGNGLPYIGASDFGNKKYAQYTTDINLPICKEEDLLILWDGARAGIVDYGHKGAISSTVVKVENKNNLFLKKYYNWYMKSFEKYFVDMSNGTTIPHMNRKFLEDLLIPEISLNEQEKIANFLDNKTSQFDSIISKKEALIEKLEEAKRSLISEVVTGKMKVIKSNDGYELIKRSSDEMKDSGIEWLGKVPKDWDIMKAARIASIVRGGSPRPAGDPKYFGGNEVPWITVAEVTKDDNKFLNSVSSYLTLLGKEQSRYLEKGTLVMSNSGATLGVPKILNISGCINDGSLAFLNLNMDKNYLYYLLKSRTEIFRKEMQISGQPNLNTDVVKSLYILKPQYKEEDIISKYLDNKTNDINILIEKGKIQIQKLKQAKQSLISEAVTGKIEILD